MKSEIIWEVSVKNTPLLKRSCHRCEHYHFYCSEKFRINAQKKNIDIWLIYKCVKCDSTYNMTIFHRAKAGSINKDLLHKFLENNLETVWKYAFSQAIARKNKVELDYGSVEYDVDYHGVPIEDLLNLDREMVSIKMKYPFDFRLKLSSVIRRGFQLSANQLNRLLRAKVIYHNREPIEKKHKLKDQMVFQVNLKELRKYW